MRERTQKIPSKETYLPLLFLKAKSFPVYSSATFHLLILQLAHSPVWTVESTAWDWCVCEPWTWGDRIYLEYVLSLLSVPLSELGGISQCFEHQQHFLFFGMKSFPKPFFPLISLNTNETKLSFHFRPALFHLCLAEGYKGQLHKTHFTNEHCSDILSAELQGLVTNTKGNISLLTFQKIRFWNPFFNSRPWSVGLFGKVPLNSRISSL